MTSKREIRRRVQRSNGALIGKVPIDGAILWVRKYMNGGVRVWAQPNKGHFSKAFQKLQQLESDVNAKQCDYPDNLSWEVRPEYADLTLKILGITEKPDIG